MPTYYGTMHPLSLAVFLKAQRKLDETLQRLRDEGHNVIIHCHDEVTIEPLSKHPQPQETDQCPTR